MTHALDDTTPLTWSACGFEDLAELHDLLSTLYYFDEPTERWSLEEIQEHYVLTGDDAAEHVVVGREADSIVAFGWNSVLDMTPAIRLAGGVHPAHRHKGIGRRLLAWQLESAARWFRRRHPGEPLTVAAFADEKAAGKRRLYERAGLRESRWMIDMHCDLRERVDVLREAATRQVPGLRFEPFSAEWNEATLDCHNEAFASVWGSAPTGLVDWTESTSRAQSRPEWSWVAVDDQDCVVGYAVNACSGAGEDGGESAEGWTERLGVRPGWRNRGVARTLLARSLVSFADAGLDRAGLGVDSRHGGGVELYRSLGYEATDTIIQYELTLEPAAVADDPSQPGATKKGRH